MLATDCTYAQILEAIRSPHGMELMSDSEVSVVFHNDVIAQSESGGEWMDSTAWDEILIVVYTVSNRVEFVFRYGLFRVSFSVDGEKLMSKVEEKTDGCI